MYFQPEFRPDISCAPVYLQITVGVAYQLIHVQSPHLFLQLNDVIKVGVVNMSIHSEETLQDGLSNCDEIPGKWHS